MFFQTRRMHFRQSSLKFFAQFEKIYYIYYQNNLSPKMFLWQVECTFDNPVAKSPKIFINLKMCSEKFFLLFLNMNKLDLWACWLSKLVFLHNYTVQILKHGFSRQPFTRGGLFKKISDVFLSVRILAGRKKIQKCSAYLQISVRKLIKIQNYRLNFCNKSSTGSS